MIEDKVVLITGVSSGIGRETAQLLAERGARVFGTVRDLGRADPIAKVELVPMDVTDDKSVKDGAESVLENAGRIDILINNAGYSIAGGLEETSIEEARQLFETNFFGALRVIQAVLPSMRRHGYGRIVNISSMLGVLPGPFRGMYVASNMRWRVTPKHWITKLERSASAQRWLSPSIQRPKSTRTKKPCKQRFQPTRIKNSG
jgi:NAD(P)-dependent dehydrogenase (short-subunit alcohol dehydrogenase family)